MKISVEWNGSDKRYVVAIYPSRWTWTEFAEFKAEVDAMIRTVPYEVGAIADVSASGLIPSNASQNLSKAYSTAPPNMGLVVNVGASPFLTIIVNIVRRIAPNSPVRNLIFVKTMAEAHALMNERYPAQSEASNSQGV
jgi:hypothetical protein